MKIYIASSWKNRHAVEMLTYLLRAKGHQIISFVEKAVFDEGRFNIKFDFEQWIASEDGLEKFYYDTDGATKSDLVIYIGPSGTDAWAEVGAAWGCGIEIIGLWAKGEPSGLMRHMVNWFTDYRMLLEAVPEAKKMSNYDTIDRGICPHCKGNMRGSGQAENNGFDWYCDKCNLKYHFNDDPGPGSYSTIRLDKSS